MSYSIHYAFCNIKLIQVTNYIKVTSLPYWLICLFKWSRNFVLLFNSAVLYQSPPIDSRFSKSSLDITSVMIFVCCIAVFPYSSVDAQTYPLRQFYHSLTDVLSSQCPPPSTRGWVNSAHAPILYLQCPLPSRRGWVISARAPFLSSVSATVTSWLTHDHACPISFLTVSATVTPWLSH